MQQLAEHAPEGKLHVLGGCLTAVPVSLLDQVPGTAERVRLFLAGVGEENLDSMIVGCCRLTDKYEPQTFKQE